MQEGFLLVIWEFFYFSVAIYSHLKLKGKQPSPIGVIAAGCIGMLYWVFYL